jgi:adenylate cyclase
MRTPTPSTSQQHAGAAWLRRARLWSEIVLVVYLTTHLANHALGLVSVAALEAGRGWFLLLWRNPLGTAVLYGALASHVGLALWSLYQRRRLHMSIGEAVQLLMGLTIPFLLTSHIVGTRLAHAWFDVQDSYTSVVLALWWSRPDLGVLQVLVVLLAWLHGCIGMHFWLRLQPWYNRVVPWLFGMAILLPTLALLGFVQAGRAVAAQARNPAWLQATLHKANAPDAAARQRLDQVRTGVPVAFGAAIGAILVARAVRRRREPRLETIQITYPDGRQAVVPVGFSVLDASRFAKIPHASVCGGRGRCSTCRVRVVQGGAGIPPASVEERRVLDRVGAPPHVRLACQLRPTHHVAVIPLLSANAQASAGFAAPGHHAGQEQEIAVLFADLRGFTRLAEPKLPYDVVFFLNRYFEAIGGAIQNAGGIANQFTGDGVMALFGVGQGPAEGCRRALLAASAMLRSLAALTQTLADELPEPLRMGIGLHTGPAVVGRMGYAETTYLTAVGDTVHVASRLEGLTKEYHCQLVLSEHVARCVGLDLTAYPRHEITVRNRTEPLAIYVVEDVHRLAAALAAGSSTTQEGDATKRHLPPQRWSRRKTITERREP